jgi:hypothetical protein
VATADNQWGPAAVNPASAQPDQPEPPIDSGEPGSAAPTRILRLPDVVADAVVRRLAADWIAATWIAVERSTDSGHAERITRVLLDAGVTHPTLLLAGLLLAAVRDGGYPLADVHRRFGEQVAVLIARQLPTPPDRIAAGPGVGAVPPEWQRVARELPFAAEALAFADLLADTTGSGSHVRPVDLGSGGLHQLPNRLVPPDLPQPRRASDATEALDGAQRPGRRMPARTGDGEAGRCAAGQRVVGNAGRPS